MMAIIPPAAPLSPCLSIWHIIHHAKDTLLSIPTYVWPFLKQNPSFLCVGVGAIRPSAQMIAIPAFQKDHRQYRTGVPKSLQPTGKRINITLKRRNPRPCARRATSASSYGLHRSVLIPFENPSAATDV